MQNTMQDNFKLHLSFGMGNIFPEEIIIECSHNLGFDKLSGTDADSFSWEIPFIG